jgi:ribosomal protein L7/L12
MSTELSLPFFTLLFLLVIGLSLIRTTLAVVERRLRALWQVEAKLDLLLQHANIQFDPYKSLPAEVTEAVRHGERVRAIKLYRDASGAGLKEARDFIDEALRRGAKT